MASLLRRAVRGRFVTLKQRLHRRFVAGTAMHPWSLVVGSLRLRRAVREGTDAESVASRVLRGWGNPRYAATPELLTAVIQAVAVADGPIVECGSGVTSIVLATAARQNGAEVLTLEHDRAWAETVRRRLRRLGLSGGSVAHRPLVARGEHDWYAVTREDVPSRIALLLCDGPPATTRGGRMGVLDLIEQVRPSVVIVDDIDRPPERLLCGRIEALGYSRDAGPRPGWGRFAVLRAAVEDGAPA